jgi:Holliday junction DNA helicase RuvA
VIGLVAGRVVARGRDHLVVDTGGVGYRVFVPPQLLGSTAGDDVCLYTRLVVREDDLSLYGFASAEEEEVFSQLLGVSGVGPKVALAVLGSLSPEQFYRALRQGDAARLVAIPGIGRKTAERILVELRDKAAAMAEEGGADGGDEALMALVALGVKPPEAERLLAETEGTIEERIKAALRRLGGVRP